MSTLTNSEDPDEMPHNATFHQGLHCLLLRYKDLQTTKKKIKIMICHPKIRTNDFPKFIASNQKEESIRIQRFKTCKED